VLVVVLVAESSQPPHANQGHVTHVVYSIQINRLFVWLVADGWCWFVLREKYCWLIAGGWFLLREKYCWLVADKPSEQGVNFHAHVHVVDM
jgi:hypothetical protein